MRRLRSTGGEAVEARAERLADVAVAGACALAGGELQGVPCADQLRAFFVAGFLACAQDVVEAQAARRSRG